MKVSEAILTRKSVRAFKPEPVSLETVQWIVETAVRAPSGGNLQPWIVRIITGKRRDALVNLMQQKFATGDVAEKPEYDIYPAELSEELRRRRRELAFAMYDAIGVSRDDRAGQARQTARNFELFDAPVGLFFSLEKFNGPPQWSDVGMLMENIMLLAREKGLHTCAQEAWASFPATLRSFFDMPESEIFFSGMAMGYIDEKHPINSVESLRVPIGDNITFEGF